MWEIEIIINRSKGQLLQVIQSSLSSVLEENQGVSAVSADSENVFLSIGSKLKNAPVIKAQLRLAIADLICEQYKFDFLNEHLDIICEDNAFRFALAKVCTYFDNDLDRQIVLQLLDLKAKKLNLDSFFHFKLSCLKEKWLELCNVTNLNSNVILKKNNFIELLRFMLSNIDKKCQSVIVEMQERCLIYHDNFKDFDIITAIEPENKLEVLGKLIELNPYLIKVYPDKENTETIKLLESIFDDRIVLA